MEFFDKNLSWEPPVGYHFSSVVAEGAYLKLAYSNSVSTEGKWPTRVTNIINIYLNDQGREVARTAVRIVDAPPELLAPPKPVAWRFRFWNAVLLTLHGLQEIGRCLNF